MGLRSWLGAGRSKVLCSVHRRLIPLGNHGPVVSFTFDDFPRSAYLAGGRILESFGARGTYYTAPALMKSSNGLGEMFDGDDLCSLLEKGHEVATHTYAHSSCRELSLKDFRDDVERGVREVERITGRQSNNFAYPYGHVTLGTKKALQNLSSSRSIFPGINGPEIDLNLLRANRLYGGVDGVGAACELIEENVVKKGWLIFYTHDVSAHPSEYGCTPEFLERAVAAASSSGSRILTVEQMLVEIGKKPQIDV